jgi:hypothetical protein
VLSKPEFSPWLVWEGEATHSSQHEFSELCRHIKGSGLLERKPAARAIVRPFCLERGIRYHETGIFQSLKEIFHHLQEIGASVRVDDPAKISNS